MTRPKLVLVHSEQAEQQPKGARKHRFELSRGMLVFYAAGLVAAFCWMFLLGALAGKGESLVSSEDATLRAGIMRFLGLGKPAVPPVQNAAATWGDPRKMMESLNYYEDLTQRGGPPPVPPLKPAAPESAAPAVAGEAGKESAKMAAVPTPPQPAASPEKPVPEPEKTARISVAGGQFTLLVASLKDPENAQRLLEQLKAKGYSPRLEAIDLNGGGRWNRVLVGAFSSREEALAFAAEFNKKESLEGLVIRE